MMILPLRLQPGVDLRAALEAVLIEQGVEAGYVLQGIGSLTTARVRFAGKSSVTELRGDLEMLSLAGSIATDGAHLHVMLSDASGQVLGGHVADGCMVRTTAEILISLLPDHRFNREVDAVSGFKELVIRLR